MNEKENLILIHERIDRLTNENLELRLLVHALLTSHSNPRELVKQIEQGHEIFVSKGLPSGVSDNVLSYIREKIIRAIGIALAQKQPKQ